MGRRRRNIDFERGFYKGMRLWLTPRGILRFAHTIETLALKEWDAKP